MNAIPTATIDQLYKFACMAGLALVVTALLSMVQGHHLALDRMLRLSDASISLESKSLRTPADEEMLQRTRALIVQAHLQEQHTNLMLTGLLVLGVGMCVAGVHRWRACARARDDHLGQLQRDKLEAEIAKIRAETDKLAREALHPPKRPLAPPFTT